MALQQIKTFGKLMLGSGLVTLVYGKVRRAGPLFPHLPPTAATTTTTTTTRLTVRMSKMLLQIVAMTRT